MPTLGEMRAEVDGWWNGYHDGQRDVLTWLSGELPDDVPLAPIAAGLEAAYAMVCLGRNLAIAGALSKAFDLGWSRGYEEGFDGTGDVWTGYSAHEHRERIAREWIANTDGKAAP